MDRVGVRQTRHVGVARCGSSSGLPCIPSLGPGFELNPPTLFSRLNPRRSPRAHPVPPPLSRRGNGKTFITPARPSSPTCRQPSCRHSSGALRHGDDRHVLSRQRNHIVASNGGSPSACVRNAAARSVGSSFGLPLWLIRQKCVKPEFLAGSRCYVSHYNTTRFSHLRLPHFSLKSEAHVGQSSFDPAHFPTTSTYPITS